MTNIGSIHIDTDEYGVTTLLMNRPSKLNSWDQRMEEEFHAAISSVERNLDKHRVLVIRGAGRSFCAGVDMELVASEQKLPGRDLRTVMSIRHRIFDWLENVEIPVIAAIHGHCLGGGLELALACDFRLASGDSIYAMPELSFGQIPGSGAASRLTAVSGSAVAKDLIMTGRKVNSEEALQLGLVTRRYEDQFDTKVAEFAQQLAQGPPACLSNRQASYYDD